MAIADFEDSVIPIFELNTNVLPGELLPLHIFEERYKSMLAYCLEERKVNKEGVAQPRPFGILLKRRNTTSHGCIMAIENVLNWYDDGRADILCRGERVFELQQFLVDGDFPRAHIRTYPDGDSIAPALIEDLIVDLRQLSSLLNQEDLVEALPKPDPFSIATVAKFDLLERQDVLGAAGGVERVNIVQNFLRFKIQLAESGGREALEGDIQIV